MRMKRMTNLVDDNDDRTIIIFTVPVGIMHGGNLTNVVNSDIFPPDGIVEGGKIADANVEDNCENIAQYFDVKLQTYKIQIFTF